MLSALSQFFQWLGDTHYSVALRESTWSYPIVESIHVLGLCLFLGFALIWDFRLLNRILKRVPVSELAARLMPWTVVGFVIMVISGLALFYSNPVRFSQNIFFQVKFVMLILAGVNALWFQMTAYRSLATWELDPVTPKIARRAAVISLTLWACIVVAGRMIAYNWFDK
jgi:hypothetical protein